MQPGKYIVSGIYRDGRRGQLPVRAAQKVASGEVANAGYYTVLLDKTVTLEAGERFAVIVEITTPGAIHPVAIGTVRRIRD